MFATGHQYNGFGEPVKTSASIGTETAVEMSYSRDALGRNTQKTEVVEGETLTNYQYDLAGRLTSDHGADIAAIYGIGKELWDLTPWGGTPDWADLEADFRGIGKACKL